MVLDRKVKASELTSESEARDIPLNWVRLAVTEIL